MTVLLMRNAVLPYLGFLLFSVPSAAVAQTRVPDEFDSDDSRSIRATYNVDRHAPIETEGAFEARNPGQEWSLSFNGRGFLVEPDASDWSWGLELVSYGFEGNEQYVGDAACVSASGGRVTYEWDDTIDEWYVNDARGLEHGYTIRQRPGTGIAVEPGPLKVAIRVRGNLSPTVEAGRRAVAFASEQGNAELTYSGLTVFDADGRLLEAWFEQSSQGLRIAVEECNARYPLTIDPVAQEAYIKASNTRPFARFGQSISVSGNTLVVGAPQEPSGSTGVNGNQSSFTEQGAGAAYVFTRASSGWSQQAFLKASNTDGYFPFAPGDWFGASVAISGDTLVVGASYERSSATGVNGNQADNAALEAGAAYVFVRTGTIWQQQAYLKASNTDPFDQFGTSVAIFGDTLVVSAIGDDSASTGVNGVQDNQPGFGTSGAVYVFVRSGTTWTQQAFIKASNTDGNDRFGSAVSLTADTLLVGAVGERSNATGVNGDETNDSALDSGAAYVFVRNGTTWVQQAYVKASNTESGDGFGSSVSLSGDTLVVGATAEASSAVGVAGDQADNGSPNSGAAYVFERSGTTWTQQAYLKASNTDANDLFGDSLSLDADSLAVGASAERSKASGIDGNQILNNGGKRGAAYLFVRSGTTWGQQSYIKPYLNPASLTYDIQFGIALSLSGDVLVVGADNESAFATGVNSDQMSSSSSGSGAAYAFDLDFNVSLSPVGTNWCSGDGGNQMGCTNCPCTNNAAPGTIGGCLNSAGTATRLLASGDASVSLGLQALTDLRFAISSAPGFSFCVLNSGDSVAPGNPVNTCFGLNTGVPAQQFDGLRCSIQNTRRHGGRSADSNGDIGVTNAPWGGEAGPPIGIAASGNGFVSGQTRYFQVINRDDPLLSCQRGLNTTQAIEITFTP